jgi:glutamine cyclotransferase
MRGGHLLLISLFTVLCAGCGQRQSTPASAAAQQSAPASSIGTERPPQGHTFRYSYEVVNTYPHDTGAFTQGLVYLDGKLIESTGLNGRSSLREDDLATGRVLRQIPIDNQYFAEGLAVLNGKAFQLTWKAQLGFIYDEATFRKLGEFHYTGEGWGLATDGHSLILSDGTAQIRFLDPATFKVERAIPVAYRGQPVVNLNELEYIKGEIFANVWQTPFVARIDPADGAVIGIIDFSGLLPLAERAPATDVLNGIAYDEARDRLFVTGKLWPRVYEVRLKRVPGE